MKKSSSGSRSVTAWNFIQNVKLLSKGQTARHMLTLRENSAWNEMDVEPIMQPWRTGGMEIKGSWEDHMKTLWSCKETDLLQKRKDCKNWNVPLESGYLRISIDNLLCALGTSGLVEHGDLPIRLRHQDNSSQLRDHLRNEVPLASGMPLPISFMKWGSLGSHMKKLESRPSYIGRRDMFWVFLMISSWNDVTHGPKVM